MDRPHWVVTNCQTGELFTRLMSQKAVSVRPVFLPEENLGEKISWSRRIIFRLLPQRFHGPNRKSNLETVSACCVAEGLSINNEKWKHWLSSWAAGVDSECCQYYTYRRPARDYPRWLSAGLAAMSADAAWPRPLYADWLIQESITRLLKLLHMRNIFLCCLLQIPRGDGVMLYLVVNSTMYRSVVEIMHPLCMMTLLYESTVHSLKWSITENTGRNN